MNRTSAHLENARQDSSRLFEPLDGLGIYEENPNPVLRVSDVGEILYANRGSNALRSKWESHHNGLVPESCCRRIIAVIESGTSQSYEEDVNDTVLQLQIVPVKGRNYANIFGYALIPGRSAEAPAREGNRRRSTRELELNRRIGFARVAVHEVRTPLTPILAASEMLVNRLEDGVTARLARQVNLGAIELNARIGELFDLVRIEMGVLALDRQPIQLCQILSEISTTLRPAAETKGAVILVETDDALPQIEGDRARLLEGLLYLVDSAIKRCPTQAVVKLRAASDTGSITIQIQVACPRVPDEVGDYFSAPPRALTMDREHFSSIGLKLTLSKMLIEMHGGSIRVVSGKESTTFTVRIPVKI